MDNSQFKVNFDKNRFELEVSGAIAYLTYEKKDDVWYLPHTIVPKELGGKGVGSNLVRQSLDYLISNNIRFKPVCSFVIKFVEKHPVYSDATYK